MTEHRADDYAPTEQWWVDDGARGEAQHYQHGPEPIEPAPADPTRGDA